MANRSSFSIGEWYHCFNRGVEKRIVFEDERDSNRFLMTLYLANGTRPVHLFDNRRPELLKVFKEDRGVPIVAVGAYCLMPNHFHLMLKEITDGGITTFMRKLGVAYTMYFNARNERVGNLFMKPFRSRHIGTDRYFQRALQYIHLNPAELYEPGWKSGRVRHMRKLEKSLLEYPYSSLRSYEEGKNTTPILSQEGFEVADHVSLSKMLVEARAYYDEVSSEGLER